LKLRKKLAQRRADASKILDQVAASPETRDMSPEEKTLFDTALKDIETLKAQVEAYKAMEADEEEEVASDMDAQADEGRSANPQRNPGRRSAPIGNAPAVHTKSHAYSYLRALRLASDKLPIDGLEGEVNREIETRSGRRAKGFFLPTGMDPELRALMAGNRRPEIRTDLTTSTGAGGIFTIPELPLIDLLRAKLVVANMGATLLTDMKGLFAIPRQSGKATVFWVAEGSGATATAPALDQVGFSPKLAIAATNISRLFLAQTSVDAETFVKNDLAASLARDFDRVAINGGGSNEPVGIMATSAVATNSAAIQGGTNGAVLNWGQITGMESQVANFNADVDKLGYITNPLLRGKMKNTLKFPSSASAVTLWEDGQVRGEGEVNGYRAMTTTNVPSNLTKGSASGVANAIIYGDWSSLVVSTWEGVDVVVNPYTNQLAGAVLVSMEMLIDVKLRHPESFSIITDALLA
jgi:HK97 family phage major capsid protein